jgi:hypothetical protein
MKNKCMYRDEITNCCSLRYQAQCEGEEWCDEFEEDE